MEYNSSLKPFLFSLTLLTIFLTRGSAQADHDFTTDTTLDQWQNTASFYSQDLSEGVEEQISIDGGASSNRRSLFWGKAFHYYISYGALSANRVPCPPRSGRSYYTHNCYGARGPVHPYTRGCSAITRCRR